MDYSDFRQDTAAWFEEYPFQWFCSLTCRPNYSVRQRQAQLHRWKAELKSALGTRDFNFVGIPEHGVTGANYHFHCLVGA